MDQLEAVSFVGILIEGKYKIIKKLSQGGMGQVYLAEHVNLQELRAIKIVPLEPGYDEILKQRFINEIKVTHRVSQHNDHIVRVYDAFGFESSFGYYVMEYLEGDLLTERIDNAPGTLPIPWCVQIAMEICDAMNSAHQEGIVHRDLKPDNIFLIKNKDDTDFVKIVDFGIAQLESSDNRLTKTGAIVGTILYLSPEQIITASPDGKALPINSRSDIYALGCILYEMLLGEPPFYVEGNNSPIAVNEILMSHLMQPPPSPREQRADIPQVLEDIILRAMAKKAEDRFDTMTDFAEALQGVLVLPKETNLSTNAFDEPDEDTFAGVPPVSLASIALDGSTIKNIKPALGAEHPTTDEVEFAPPEGEDHAATFVRATPPPPSTAFVSTKGQTSSFEEEFEAGLLSYEEEFELETVISYEEEFELETVISLPSSLPTAMRPLPTLQTPPRQPNPLPTASVDGLVLQKPTKSLAWHMLVASGVVCTILGALAISFFWQGDRGLGKGAVTRNKPELPLFLRQLKANYQAGSQLYQKALKSKSDDLFLQAAARWKLMIQTENFKRSTYYPSLYLGIADAYKNAKHLRLTRKYYRRYVKASPASDTAAQKITKKFIPALRADIHVRRKQAELYTKRLQGELRKDDLRAALHRYHATLNMAPSMPRIHMGLARMLVPLFPSVSKRLYIRILTHLEPNAADTNAIKQGLARLKILQQKQQKQITGLVQQVGPQLEQKAYRRVWKFLGKELRSLSLLLQPTLHKQIQSWLRQLAFTAPGQATILLRLYQQKLEVLAKKGLYGWLHAGGLVLPTPSQFPQQRAVLTMLPKLRATLRKGHRVMTAGRLTAARKIYAKALKQWQAVAKQDKWQYTQAYATQMHQILGQQKRVASAIVLKRKATLYYKQGRFQQATRAYKGLLQLLHQTPAQKRLQREYRDVSVKIQRGRRALALGRRYFRQKLWNRAWKSFKQYKELFPSAWNRKQVEHWYHIATCEAGVVWKPCENLRKRRKGTP